MKILLLEKNQEAAEKIKTVLNGEGYEIIHMPEHSQAGFAWEQSPHIQVIIFGGATNEELPLIETLRQYQPYTFLCCITSEPQSPFYTSGADQVCLPDDPVDLVCKIGTIVRSQHLLTTCQKNREIKTEYLQVINLNKGLTFVDNDKSLYLELLEVLLDTLKPLQSDPTQLTILVARELQSNADSLGAEKLHYWLINSIFHHEFLNLSEQTVSNQQQSLGQLFTQLQNEINLLTKAGFFVKETKAAEDILSTSRILLVEDLIHNRILVQQIFKKHKPEIIEAVQGEDAIEKWEESGPFDLILMDMNMPVMDGFEATKAIRQKEIDKGLEKAPILALTALAMRGDREACIAAGCSDYMPKPLEPRQLVQTAKNMLSHRKRAPISLIKKEKWWKVQKAAILTDNLKYRFILESHLKSLNLEFTHCESEDTLLLMIKEGNLDLVFVDASKQMELCFFIKMHYPNQEICLLLSNQHTSRFSADLPNALNYPFSLDQLKNRIGYHSHRMLETEQGQSFTKELEELKTIKNISNLSETQKLSRGQISVWQKTFRKIGGDLVLCHQFNLHGRLGFIMADVSGHDMQSGYTANWFAGLVEGVWGNKSGPIELVQYLNQLFTHGYEEEDKRYVCALALLWDPIRNKLAYANAGIPGGILTKIEDTEVKYIDWKGPPIGMFDEDHLFDSGEIDFGTGDRLFIATDGVLENIPNEVIVSLSKGQKSTQETLDRIVDFVLRSMEVKDDLTIAVFDPQVPTLPEGSYRSCITGEEASGGTELDNIGNFITNNSSNTYDWPMISVATKEALLNAAEHGNKNHLALPIDIDVELTEKPSLKITISDCGSGFDLNFEKKRIQEEGQLRIQGRGIEIMEHVASSVTFTGASIVLEFAPASETK